RVSVRGRFRDRGGSDHRSSSRPILDDDGLSEAIRELWPENAAESVDRPTGWPRSDQRDPARRVIFGSRKQNGLRGEQHANNRWRGETRTRGSRAAEKRDERAAPHSITSSASASNLSGISRPSALAVLGLSTNSNFVGSITGRSLGFSPLRMRPE